MNDEYEYDDEYELYEYELYEYDEYEYVYDDEWWVWVWVWWWVW